MAEYGLVAPKHLSSIAQSDARLARGCRQRSDGSFSRLLQGLWADLMELDGEFASWIQRLRRWRRAIRWRGVFNNCMESAR